MYDQEKDRTGLEDIRLREQKVWIALNLLSIGKSDEAEKLLKSVVESFEKDHSWGERNFYYILAKQQLAKIE